MHIYCLASCFLPAACRWQRWLRREKALLERRERWAAPGASLTGLPGTSHSSGARYSKPGFLLTPPWAAVSPLLSPSKPRRDISGQGGTGWVARGRRSPRCPRQDGARSGLSLPTPGGGGEEQEGKNPAWSPAGRLSWRRPLRREPLLSHGSSTGGCCTRLTQGPRRLRGAGCAAAAKIAPPSPSTWYTESPLMQKRLPCPPALTSGGCAETVPGGGSRRRAAP